MRDLGLAALTMLVGLALGVIIGLLVNQSDGDAVDKLAGVQAQLAATSADLEAANGDLEALQQLLEQTEAGRRAVEAELEQALDGTGTTASELGSQLEAAQAEIERLLEENVANSERLAEARDAVTPHVFMLQELFAYAQAGFAGQQFSSDPAVLDALDELAPDLAVLVEQLFAEPDPTTAEVQYWSVVQQVLNSLQAAMLG